MSAEPDLSAFPVLRIDQIPRIRSDTLADAQKEAKHLIQSILAESSDGTIPSMVTYLRKQNDAIANELLNRLAQDRISQLLTGATSLLNNDREKYVQIDDDERSTSSMSTLTQKSGVTLTPVAPPPVNPSFQPLPLPSERRKVTTEALNLTSMTQNRSGASVVSEDSGSVEHVQTLRRSETSPVGIAMSSRSTTEHDSSYPLGGNEEGSPSAQQSRAPRRPRSGSEDTRPNRRSQQIINDNFGKMFIVSGGEGRRRRPLPPKKVVEPIEEVKARERLERRKAAMQRLLERKEQRQQAQLAQREKRRQAQLEAEKSEAEGRTQPTRRQRTERDGSAAASATAASLGKPPSGRTAETAAPRDAPDSSGSESVSGGEDEVEVEVNADMVNAVAEAQAQEIRRQQEEQQNAPQLADNSHDGDGSASQSVKLTFSNVKNPLGRQLSGSAIDVNSPSKAARGDGHVRSSPGATNRAVGTAVSPSAVKKQRSTAKVAAADDASNSNSGSPQRRAARREASNTRIPRKVTTKDQSERKAGINHTTAPLTDERHVGEPDSGVSQEELAAKNSAALISLRSMKLKKEQLRVNSFKTALSFAESLALTPMETAAEAGEEVDMDVGLAASTGAEIVISRASTALSIRPTEEVSLPNTERAMTAYTEPCSTLTERNDVGGQLAVRPGQDLVKSEKELVGYEFSDVHTQENTRQIGDGDVEDNAAQDFSTIHVRESSLQLDADPGPAPAPARPSTVPNPPSPSRWDTYASSPRSPQRGGTYSPSEYGPSSPARRRNSVGSLPTEHSQAMPVVAESVDLSGETLEVEPVHGKFTIPVTERIIVGPTHPAVSQILTGHVHSAVLGVQDGQYYAKLGADDLPGLCAWKLASIVDECANWVVNIAKYARVVPNAPRDSAHSGVFARRAATRRSVSLGLLVLLLDTEDILLGRVRLYSAEHFTTLWKEYIRLFDEKAEALAIQYGPDVLFTETAVCGNCHAICKKLENLLKTLFVPRSSSAEAVLHRALHAQEEYLPPPSPRDADEEEQHAPTRSNAGTRASTAAARSCTPSDDDYVSDAYDGGYTSETAPQAPSGNQSEVDDTDLDGRSLVDDDEASIVPVYPPSLYNQFLAQQEQERIAEEAGLQQELSTTDQRAPSAEQPSSSISRTDSTGTTSGGGKVQRRSKEPTTMAMQPRSGEKSVPLTTFYPTIAAIFPAVYTLMGTRQPDDGSGAARQLIESMQVQCKMYEEWIEVMSDYSTVFSEGRGVSEHHYDKDREGGGEENGGDPSGNANVYKGGTRSLHYRVKSGRSEVNNIVSDVFANFLQQWEELPAGLGLGLSWNILWTWSKPRIKMTHLLAWQRVNHYPDSKELTRKDLLKKNVQRYTIMGGKGGAYFDIMPQTFLLPHEYTAFVQAFTAAEANKMADGAQNFWILKPIGLSRGRGISLVKDLGQIAYSQSSVVQRYIERPLCLQGYKFDLRLYILVTSFKPLEAFIYRDGFARVSTHQYSLNPADTDNKFIHLTNSSIQSQNTEGITKDSPLQMTGEDERDNDTGGSKISLLGANGLWKRLQSFGVDTAALWQSICLLVIKSLVIVDDRIAHQPCCFEMFGYDVLVDADLRPWLLEVNASPSLARTNALDVRVKNAMIRDIINIIDPAPFDRAAVLRILQRRLGNIAKNRFTVGKNDPELEQDLRDILGDHVPRKYGETPAMMGNYEMLCPNTKEYVQVVKVKRKIIKS